MLVNGYPLEISQNNTDGTCLMSVYSVSISSYDRAEQRDLQLVLKVLAVAIFLCSHDQNECP